MPTLRIEKENDLLRTTYAKCIEEQVESLRNAPCGTCDRIKFENEFLSKRCKSLIAKSFDSRDSCHSDVGVSKIASSQPELASSVERESLDVSTCGCVSDSSSIASPKLASSGVAQSDSDGKGASHFFGAHISKPKFHCTFCKKDGHTVEFCFRRVKHERRVRAKASRMSCSLSHGTCDSKLGTKYRVDAVVLSLKGLLTLERMVIRPLGPCLEIGLCTIALFVRMMGIKRAFAIAVQDICGELVLLGL